MFTNLIESASHRREFKRRSSFFVITVATYVVILFAAGIASVYAYDAQLESQSSSLEFLSWVPPVVRENTRPIRENQTQVRRPQPSSAPIDSTVDRPIRTDFVASTNDPTKIPDKVGTVASAAQVYTKGAVLGDRNVNPPPTVQGDGGCVICAGTPPRVEVEEKPPEPPVVKAPTKTVPSTVLISKVISLPQPAYPIMAKQTGTHGPVNIQILVDEQGKVISAQVVSGHPMLNPAARDAAMRARFTPTVLNGQPVKIQGVITYNFVLQ